MQTIRILGLMSALIVLILDQFSKQWILSWFMADGHPITLTPFLNLIFAWNPGVSFGFLRAGSPQASMALLALAGSISTLIAVWLWYAKNTYQSILFGAILGGALGNMIDRWKFGAVVDFIDFHVLGYHWYVFNLADCGVVIGAILLVIGSFVVDNQSEV
jgi:signal peptidase II